MKTKQKFEIVSKIVNIIFVLSLSFCYLFMLMEYDAKLGRTLETKELIYLYAAVMIFYYISLIINTIIHELGHLIAGLLNGYKFLNFRIFNLLIVKENQKIKIRWAKRPSGILGQCLMTPPEKINEKKSIQIYIIGGIIINLILGITSLIISCLFINNIILFTFIAILGIVGIHSAISNSIPIVTKKGVILDGYIFFETCKNPKATRSYSLYLKIINSIYSKDNIKLKDLPEELFEVQESEDMNFMSDIILTIMSIDRLIEQKKYKKACKIITNILELDVYIPDILRYQLVNEQIFLMIITGKSKEKIISINSKITEKDIKKYKNPFVIHTKYAYELLINNNVKEAKKYKKEFEEFTKIKTSKKIEEIVKEEKEYIKLINKIYKSKSSN